MTAVTTIPVPIESHQDNRRMFRGAIDLDGVVAELVKRTIQYANIRYGCKTDRNHQFCNYDMSQGSDITKEIYKEIFGLPGFYRNAEPMPYALTALDRLYSSDYQLNIITVRPNTEHVRNDTLHWLAEQFVPFDSLHIVSRHQSYEGGADAKAVIAKGLGLGWAVEDSPFNARSYAAVCDVVYLVNASYNVNEPMPDNVVRVNNLEDMVVDLRRRNAPVDKTMYGV